MWPRSFSVAAARVRPSLGRLSLACVSLACLSLACSGEGSAPSREPTEPPGDTAEDPAASEWILPAGSEIRLSIDGRAEPMGANARLSVQEGVRSVHLSITGADGAADLVILDLEFDGLESSLGPHQGSVGLPHTGVYTVTASLDGHPYHSQAGYIELSLAADGSIEGTFNVDLAEDPQAAIEQPFEILPSDQLRALSGQFIGQWVLRCQSRLPGHRSFILGGEYCESLEF